ncbi:MULTISPECIES: hypothetical protein [Streptomyces]|uniref:Uncharacterized protein n=1 Tax=Streptomyces mirabilis TaxID=68239 RepID=A0ABU3UB78_9ACTN|nr:MULTISPECIES: hypothetical protein [Streptomyces]MCX4617025.1 hypothetical protein [Streptomyces mirabilis]MCX5355255.1 hypothetical protein [Streptomyces mirabilis]MDU8991172.1 hypothetical protein [Streptomyces mirabilis]QDN92979.1 hypothetical protein FNV61_52940 [Streptomyces sp. RLB3-6]QDO13800.1 hypothetical protein FNV68_54000 [Streptomyces sp. S1D4-23]
MPELEMDCLATNRAIGADEDLVGVKIVILTTFEETRASPGPRSPVPADSSASASTPPTRSKPSDKAVRVVAAGEALLSPTAARGRPAIDPDRRT